MPCSCVICSNVGMDSQSGCSRDRIVCRLGNCCLRLVSFQGAQSEPARQPLVNANHVDTVRGKARVWDSHLLQRAALLAGARRPLQDDYLCPSLRRKWFLEKEKEAACFGLATCCLGGLHASIPFCVSRKRRRPRATETQLAAGRLLASASLRPTSSSSSPLASSSKTDRPTDLFRQLSGQICSAISASNRDLFIVPRENCPAA